LLAKLEQSRKNVIADTPSGSYDQGGEAVDRRGKEGNQGWIKAGRLCGGNLEEAITAVGKAWEVGPE